ncbi:MAG: HAD family hydrolase [Chlamydiota bacterium]
MKLESALARMIQAGLEIPDFNSALEQLLRLDRCAESGHRALSEFLEIVAAPHGFLELALKEVYHTSCSEISVDPVDGAVEILEELALHHELAIVTIGRQEQQMEKMKNAGIDSTIFSKIIVCGGPDKGPSYQAVVEALGIADVDVIVCGDRITTDLSPAKALGFKTIHVRWGRGLNSVGPKGDVDYSISKLADIKDYLS